MTETRLNIQSHALALMLRVKEAIIGGQIIELRSDDNQINLRIPKQFFPFAAQDDMVAVTLGVTKVAVEAEPPPGLTLPGLTGLERAN